MCVIEYVHMTNQNRLFEVLLECSCFQTRQIDTIKGRLCPIFRTILFLTQSTGPSTPHPGTNKSPLTRKMLLWTAPCRVVHRWRGPRRVPPGWGTSSPQASATFWHVENSPAFSRCRACSPLALIWSHLPSQEGPPAEKHSGYLANTIIELVSLNKIWPAHPLRVIKNWLELGQFDYFSPN